MTAVLFWVVPWPGRDGRERLDRSDRAVAVSANPALPSELEDAAPTRTIAATGADETGPVPENSEAQVVTGVVLSERGAPVSDAVVSAYGEGEEWDVAVVEEHVDGDGRFSLPIPDREPRTLLARSPTHVDGSRHDVRAGDDVVIVLDEGTLITGIVLDAGTEEPLEGAAASFGGSAGALVKTGADGRFRTVARVPVLRASVACDGYVGWHEVMFAPTPEGPPLELRLARAPPPDAAWFRFVDEETRQGVTTVSAEPGPVEPAPGGLSRVGCYSNDDDRWLRIDAAGYVPLDLGFPAEHGATFDDAIEFALSRPRAITGTITAPNGATLANVSVRVTSRWTEGWPATWNVSARTPPVATSLPDGTFRLTPVLPNTHHQLTFECADHPSRVIGDVFATTDPETDAGTIVMEPGFRLAGRVTRARDGAPAADAEVTAWIGYRESSTWTDPDGRFELSGLPESATIRVEARGLLPFAARWDVATRPSLEVRLDEGLGIDGTVLEEEGRPVFGALVWIERQFSNARDFDRELRNARREQRQTQTAPDGTFRFAGLPAGRYVIEASRGDRRLVPSEQVDAGATGVTLNLRSPAGLVLRVHSSMTGSPVPAFRAALDAYGRGGVAASGDGVAFVALTPNLEYRLEVTAKEHAMAIVDGISVRPGERRELAVTLTAGASLTGVVRDDDGAPVSGVSLVPIPTDGSRKFYNGTVTDGTGRFEFNGLPAGEYRFRTTLRSSEPDLHRERPIELVPATLAVGAGQRLERDLRVVELGATEVRITLDLPASQDVHRIHFALTREPTPGERVRFEASGPQLSRFSLSAVPPGTYAVNLDVTTISPAGKYGRLDLTAEPASFTVPAVGPVDLNVVLRPATSK